jgi:hypothetical protein
METQINQRNHEIARKILSEMVDFTSIPFVVRFSIWRTRCLDSLVVNRYLDEDERFYKSAEVVLRFLENMQVHAPWIHELSENDKMTALDYFIGRIGKNFIKAHKIWLDLLEETYLEISKKMETMISGTGFKTIKELRSAFHSVFHKYDWTRK